MTKPVGPKNPNTASTKSEGTGAPKELTNLAEKVKAIPKEGNFSQKSSKNSLEGKVSKGNVGSSISEEIANIASKIFPKAK